MRLALIVSLAFLSPLTTRAQALSQKAPSHSSPKLELRLVATRSAVRSGDKVRFKVELWNVGAEDVVIAQNLASTFGNSALSLTLETDSGGEWFGAIGDSFPEPGEPNFEETFVTNWLTLNKTHFYGTYVYMDPIEFPHLRKPGRYQVRAQYYSRGISSTPGWNGAFLKQADVEKLPLVAFQGTLNSNVVTIQVVPRTKAMKR